MAPECLSISQLPGTTALFRDYTEPAAASDPSALRRWYPADPFSMHWAHRSAEHLQHLDAGKPPHRTRLADELHRQATSQQASPHTLANIELLRNGASAVVTGQQVGLFGGPLLTLLKAATAIRKAQDATAATGHPHVPIFWLATEDHDLAEVDQAAIPTKAGMETLTLGLHSSPPSPVGALPIGEHPQILDQLLDQLSGLLAWAPIADLLRDCYAPAATLASAFARLLASIFAPYGLIVMDAASRELHALGAPALRAAIEQAAPLEAALLARSAELTAAGYHAQVLVTPGHSLLFLLDASTGARLPLRRSAEGIWKAGQQTYTTAELLAILEAAPERLSPNALLRPIVQDTILPTAAYIAGPAEVAYFAQSAVVYEQVLGRITPVLPRLSATLVEPAIAAVMAQHEVTLQQVWESKTPDALALRLGARAMPIEGKRRIAAVGNAMDTELSSLTAYLATLSPDLARSAGISASKMRYQMARLRRMAAAFELQKQASLLKHATAITLALFPDAHLQERLTAGVWFLARHAETLPTLLIENAAQECPGHRVLYL